MAGRNVQLNFGGTSVGIRSGFSCPGKGGKHNFHMENVKNHAW